MTLSRLSFHILELKRERERNFLIVGLSSYGSTGIFLSFTNTFHNEASFNILSFLYVFIQAIIIMIIVRKKASILLYIFS